MPAVGDHAADKFQVLPGFLTLFCSSRASSTFSIQLDAAGTSNILYRLSEINHGVPQGMMYNLCDLSMSIPSPTGPATGAVAGQPQSEPATASCRGLLVWQPHDVMAALSQACRGCGKPSFRDLPGLMHRFPGVSYSPMVLRVDLSERSRRLQSQISICEVPLTVSSEVCIARPGTLSISQWSFCTLALSLRKTLSHERSKLLLAMHLPRSHTLAS